MIIDPIADMINRIKNAQKIQKDLVIIPKSNIKLALLEVLRNENYIQDYKIEKVNKEIENISIKLKYNNNRPPILEFKRLSKPGRRIYRSFHNIPRSLNGLGTIIISTPQGLMSEKNARKRHLGGELICEIY